MRWISLLQVQKDILKLVKKYKTNDPFKLAELLGIYIFFGDLGDTLGFVHRSHRIVMININYNLTEELKRFVCAHELAHALLHKHLSVPSMRRNTFFSVDKNEMEANRFATYLLLYGKNFEDYETKFDILRDCGIPIEMERYL